MSEPINDEQLAQLCPTLFCGDGSEQADVDEEIRSHFFRIYKPLRDSGLNSYDLSRIASALFYYRPLLSRLLYPAKDKTAVEIGSGRGLKALCWADLFSSYIGIELNEERAQQSREILSRFAVENARIITDNAERIIASPGKYGIDRIDLLVLYAVLEHMTLAERKSVLQLAHQVYRNGGHVLIAESPNRLSRFDSHSFQLPFVEFLPGELLIAYAANSQREDLKGQLRSIPPGGIEEALYRVGRGISFHEFELAWGKDGLEQIGIVSDGFSPELLNLQPFCREEWDLLRFCSDNELGVSRLFTRYWIEGIFSRGNQSQRRPVQYLSPLELNAGPVQERRRFWELDEVKLSEGESINVEAQQLGHPALNPLILMDIERSSGILEFGSSRDGQSYTINLAAIRHGRLPSWHTHVALPVKAVDGNGFYVRLHGKGSLLTCHGVLFI